MKMRINRVIILKHFLIILMHVFYLKIQTYITLFAEMK